MSPEAFMLAGLILAAAMLYSSVGHAGASGYLAAMALFGLAPEVMKPTALVLNILVATIGTIRFARAGCFDWRLFWPFAITAIPLAFVGGATTLPGHWYRRIVGAVLLVAAINLLLKRDRPRSAADSSAQATAGHPPIWLSLIVGGGLGLLAGLTGTGGGIFLSPLLVLTGWADPKRTAGVSVVFILVNSIAGLGGQLSTLPSLPREIWLWAPAAVVGGLIGSSLGAKRFGNPTIRRLLAVVLIIAAAKMILA
jgi:hypothetical protein